MVLESLSSPHRRSQTVILVSSPPEKQTPIGGQEFDSWSILLQRHRFLLTMLTLLAILCTIYLYFAITFGVAIDSCSGLSGAKKALCQAKALDVRKFKP